MTIRTKCNLSCDIGLACVKQIVKTIESPTAPVDIRVWATTNGWHSYGQRDACPECWKALHAPTIPKHRAPDELPELGSPEFGATVQREMDAKGVTLPELVRAAKAAKEPRGPDEDIQAAIDGERGG